MPFKAEATNSHHFRRKFTGRKREIRDFVAESRACRGIRVTSRSVVWKSVGRTGLKDPATAALTLVESAKTETRRRSHDGRDEKNEG